MLLLRSSLDQHVEPLRSSREPVRVFYFSLDAPDDRHAELHALLSTHERERGARFKSGEHRLRFIAARAGLRFLLGALHGAEAEKLSIETDTYGKPFVPGSSLHFNLSHAGSAAAVAVAFERRVGIDLEAIRPVPDALELAERFFAPSEAERLRAISEPADRSRAFLECWTRKEAFVKAVGRGLLQPLNSFAVSFFPVARASLTSDQMDVTPWSLHALDLLPGYCAALVEERPQPAVLPPYRLYPCRW